MTTERELIDESEALAHAPRPPLGNQKVYHYHGNGQATKIVWAWACGTTGVLVAIVGVVALYFAGQQNETNRDVARALTDLAVKVGQIETKIDNLERDP